MTHVFEGEFVHQNLGRIRKEFRVDQMCEWETRKIAVRGLFFCEHGIVIDTCEEFDHLGEQAMQYLKIALREKDTQVIPFCADGTYWVPVEAGEAKDMETEKWMEYYQCDQKRFWKFQRYFYEWTGEIPKRLELSVKPEKTRYEGTSFAVKAGAVDQKVEVMHPVTKEHYELNIKESVDERIEVPDMEGLKFPEHVLKITYEIAPQPKDDFYLQDCEEGDTVWTTAHGKRSVSVIGGQSGPTSIFLAGTIESGDQVAYSSPHFHPVKETIWKPVFYRQELEEKYLSIRLDKSCLKQW